MDTFQIRTPAGGENFATTIAGGLLLTWQYINAVVAKPRPEYGCNGTRWQPK